MRFFLALFFLLSCSLVSKGQEIKPTDSTNLRLGKGNNEIETFQSQDTTHSPRLAAMYSAAVPGMGQFYNQKYWKIPVIYALGAFAAFQVKTNHQNYLRFRNVYFNIIDGDNTNDSEIEDFLLLFDADRAERRVEAYKRDRDYWIILSGLFYVLNIVDATVDAHLREFNINQDLSLKVKPSIQSSPYSNMHAGLSLNFRLK